MTREPTEPIGFPGLLIALISALALHGLVFSYLQLKRPRVAASAGLQSQDNTPELLQLSREPAPMTQLDLLPLPDARILPPPPVQLPVKPPGIKPKVQTKKPNKGVSQAVTRLRPAAVSTSPTSPRNPDGFNELEPAVETLRVFQRQLTLALTPSQQDVYNTLWSEARPQPRGLGPTPLLLSAPPLEIRSIALQKVQSKEIPIRHKQLIVMDERIALFWLQGSQLWILQSAFSAHPGPDSDATSKTRSDG